MQQSRPVTKNVSRPKGAVIRAKPGAEPWGTSLGLRTAGMKNRIVYQPFVYEHTETKSTQA